MNHPTRFVLAAAIVVSIALIVVRAPFVHAPGEAERPDMLPPTNDTHGFDTSAWTTYSSDALGFNLRYPAEWTVAEVNGGVTLTSPETKAAAEAFAASGNMGEGGPSIDVAITRYGDKPFDAYLAAFGATGTCASVEDCLAAAKKQIGDFGPVENVTVGGQDALKYTLPGLYASDYVAVDHNGVYEFAFLGGMTDVERAVLGTVTFIK